MKNYTSTVPASRSISNIEHYLSKKGALNISKTFKDEKVESIFFQIDLNGAPVPFKLPANIEACYNALRRERKRPPDKAGEKKLREQAERTAWKIISEWVEIQISLIEMEQAEFLEIFLPYVHNGNKTYFEKLKSENFKMLPGVK